MTLTELITKLQGKYLEVAGSADAKNQCVDLANGYIRDVLGLPIIEWTNAVDFPTKASEKYDYIKNTQTNIPQVGDLIIWKPNPGHIAVFIEGNVDKFKSFDQNFPIGSPCHIQDHTYINVTGWLRVKEVSENLDLRKEVANLRIQLNDLDRQKKEWEDKATISDNFRKSLSKKLFNNEEAQWQPIFDDVAKAIKEADDNKFKADLSLRLWNKIQEKTSTTYTYPEQEQLLLQALEEIKVAPVAQPVKSLGRFEHLLKFLFGK